MCRNCLELDKEVFGKEAKKQRSKEGVLHKPAHARLLGMYKERG